VLSSCSLLKAEEPGSWLLFVVRTRHAVSEVSVHDAASGRELHRVPLPGSGTVGEVSTHPDGGPSAWFCYTDHTTPPTVMRYDAGSRSVSRGPATSGRAEAATVSSRREVCTSGDGTGVRLFVIAPRGGAAGPDRPRPTILTGYGGFGVSMVPGFHAEALSWVEAGGVFVIACLRGGGEEGHAWHQAGMRENKQNTFDDFHAAAQWLVTNGWTTPDQLGIAGGSNGGLLVAVALTQRPELYAAGVCLAPLTDMSRYELFGLGPAWRQEYGSRDDPRELDWLLSYSPYHRVTTGTAYPATLLVAYEGDTRVDPLHARKLCAALQHATTGEAPILLHSIPRVGHGARPLSRAAAIGADTLAFLGHHTGLGG